MLLAFIQNLGPWQILICLVVVFVLFGGARKIPDLARSLGKAKNEFKRGLREEPDDDEEEEDEDDEEDEEEEETKELEPPKKSKKSKYKAKKQKERV